MAIKDEALWKRLVYLLVFVAGIGLAVAIVAGVFIYKDVNRNNTVLDADGNPLVFDLPGSVGQSVAWMPTGVIGNQEPLSDAVLKSITPAFPACTEDQLQHLEQKTRCSVLIDNSCRGSLQFIHFVVREGPSFASNGAVAALSLPRLQGYVHNACAKVTTTTATVQPNMPKADSNYNFEALSAASVARNCSRDSDTPLLRTQLPAGNNMEIWQNRCGTSDTVLVFESASSPMCFLDTSLLDTQAIKFEQTSDGIILRTTDLGGSRGEPNSVAMKITFQEGRYVATSEDVDPSGFALRFRCGGK